MKVLKCFRKISCDFQSFSKHTIEKFLLRCRACFVSSTIYRTFTCPFILRVTVHHAAARLGLARLGLRRAPPPAWRGEGRILLLVPRDRRNFPQGATRNSGRRRVGQRGLGGPALGGEYFSYVRPSASPGPARPGPPQPCDVGPRTRRRGPRIARSQPVPGRSERRRTCGGACRQGG